jgi:hypothetical protein
MPEVLVCKKWRAKISFTILAHGKFEEVAEKLINAAALGWRGRSRPAWKWALFICR